MPQSLLDPELPKIRLRAQSSRTLEPLFDAKADPDRRPCLKNASWCPGQGERFKGRRYVASKKQEPGTRIPWFLAHAAQGERTHKLLLGEWELGPV